MHGRDSIPIAWETRQIPWAYIVTNGTRVSQNSCLIVKDYFGYFHQLIKK